MRHKISFFEVESSEQKFFEHHLSHTADLTFSDDRLTPENADIARHADIIVSFIYSDLSQATLDKLPQLKAIVSLSAGTNHIDLIEANRKSITVSNVPSYGPNTVAEHTIALLLAMSRNIVPSIERTKAGIYDYIGLTGWDVMDKTIGIIGTGKIGSHVARMSWGLQMDILAYDLKPNPDLTKKFGVKYVSLGELYSMSDIVTIHTPLVADNQHMIGEEEFNKMKKGVVLLNTARGGLIDAQALIDALDSGKVASAGLDVLDDERLLKEERQFFSKYFRMKDYQTVLADQALMRHPKVLVTPHNAFNSREALHNILETAVLDIKGIIEHNPINVVEK